MAEITKIYRQAMPAVRFIGKKYTENDAKNGYYIDQWQQFITEGWFRPLTGALPDWEFEGSDSPIGLIRHKEGEPSQYWIGRFLPLTYHVPEGYNHIEYPAGHLGVCHVRGKGLDIYRQEALCLPELDRHGAELVADGDGAFWMFERYEFPRSRRPDAEGCLTLDYCFFIGE